MDRDPLVQLCFDHLSTLGITLWGEAHEIITVKGREAAAEWLARQVRALEVAGIAMAHLPRKP